MQRGLPEPAAFCLFVKRGQQQQISNELRRFVPQNAHKGRGLRAPFY